MKTFLQSVHPVLMARDVTDSIRFYERLGFTLLFQDTPEHPKYAGIQRDNVELHIQWGDPSQWAYPTDRPVYRFVVEDVDQLYEEFAISSHTDSEASGRSPWAAPAETPWGTREFHVRDPGGNILQFYRVL